MSYSQYKKKPNSFWSKVNKNLIVYLDFVFVWEEGKGGENFGGNGRKGNIGESLAFFEGVMEILMSDIFLLKVL